MLAQSSAGCFGTSSDFHDEVACAERSYNRFVARAQSHRMAVRSLRTRQHESRRQRLDTDPLEAGSREHVLDVAARVEAVDGLRRSQLASLSFGRNPSTRRTPRRKTRPQLRALSYRIGPEVQRVHGDRLGEGGVAKQQVAAVGARQVHPPAHDERRRAPSGGSASPPSNRSLRRSRRERRVRSRRRCARAQSRAQGRS